MGDKLSPALLHLWFRAQTTQLIWHRRGWGTRKQVLHKWVPLRQFQHFYSWQESCLQVNFKLGLFCEPARRKIPLATVVPVQLYYFCSKEDKNSLSNKTFTRIWNISREKASIAVSCHSQCSETANEKLETQFTAAIAWKEELDCLPSPLRTLLSESALNILPGRMVLGCYRRLIIHHQTPLHYPAV